MEDELIKLLSNLKEQETIQFAEKRLASGDDPMSILDDARKGMQIVGERFSEGTYFIPDLVYSGKILERVAEIVKPNLAQDSNIERHGKVVVGTVAGDLHDIGKNLVSFMLDVNGFEVFDLGVDVSAQAFVDKIKEVKPDVVGLSGFLTSIYQTMKDTVDAISSAGLKDNVKIMVGGGVIDEKVREFCDADAYGVDAMAAVNLAKKWIGVA